MPIVASFVLPHPPIIVNEIGKGEEAVVLKTIQSYEKVCKRIAELKPDTIIIASPHAECYQDCFFLSSAKRGKASFYRFYAPEVTFENEYDQELTLAILDQAIKRHVPAYLHDGLETEDFSFDHGCLVPLYYLNKVYKDYKLVRLPVSGLSYLEHYKMGVSIQRGLEQCPRRAVFIASGDLSHCQKEDGPYGYKPIGPLYDEKIMKTLGEGDFLSLLQYDPEMVDDAEVCGHPSFCIMAGALDNYALESMVYSHENTFGIGYGIVGYEVIGKTSGRRFRQQYEKIEWNRIFEKKEKQDNYVALAREAIDYYVKKGEALPLNENLEKELLENKAGVFVSIHEYGRLRGCIGTLLPTKKNVALEIIQNAISACSQDPRFAPVELGELPYLDINVDVLSPFEKVDSEDQLDCKKYGVIVKSFDERQGVLLPDLKGVDSVEEQLRIAKRKAGISQHEKVEIYRFTVIRHV